MLHQKLVTLFVEMPATVTKRREVYILYGAVRLRAVRTVDKLFVPSERTIMQGGEEQIKVCYVRGCSAQCCSDSFI